MHEQQKAGDGTRPDGGGNGARPDAFGDGPLLPVISPHLGADLSFSPLGRSGRSLCEEQYLDFGSISCWLRDYTKFQFPHLLSRDKNGTSPLILRSLSTS